MPTAYRHWYINRLLKHIKDVNSKEDNNSESISDNLRKVDEYISKL